MEWGDMGSGCEGENCGHASGFSEDCLGPECHVEEPMFGLIELVCVTVICIPLMLFGFLGNLLTILVVWLRPQMRSSTYLYLSSMAVSDLLILLLLPLDLYKLWMPRPWPLGDLACKLTMFLSECCTFCTILHITFLSLERYLAVCWPITAKTLLTRRRTRALIGCLWLGAAVSAAPVLIMVGVEDVGGEALGLGEWSEGGGLTRKNGEQGGFMIGAGERGSGHNGRLEETDWRDKQKMGWSERVGDLIWFGEEGESKAGTEERGERNQGDGRKKEFENQVDDRGEEKGEMGAEGERQNKMKEDEGGGRGEGNIDNRECRCTHFAVSSGLLSAMMVVSNLYFLVPVCILGLVYSLIGRTLYLRPQSSRRDQSHRHTVKMLGVIVLAFVLCWLPFHVGRTIFFFSMDSISDTHADINNLSHVTTDTDIDAHTKPINRSDSNAHLETRKTTARAHAERGGILCEACAKTDDHPNRFTHKGDANNTRGNRPSGTHVRTVEQNGTLAWIRSQNNTRQHALSTRSGTPTGLSNDGTLNDRRFNGTHPHPDTAAYFLYYLSQYFNLVSSVLFYLSAAINPLLYNLMSAKYRHAVRSLLHAQSRRLRTFTARHSTTRNSTTCQSTTCHSTTRHSTTRHSTTRHSTTCHSTTTL